MSSVPIRRSALDLVAIAGLAAGAIFGLAGTMVAQAALRQVFWAIDGVGLVVATVLLAVRHLRQGADGVAAGFLVFALGETLLVAGNAGGLEAGMTNGQPLVIRPVGGGPVPDLRAARLPRVGAHCRRRGGRAVRGGGRANRDR